MEKQIRKPQNWQDFETLCKKLWGEVWDCKETIKKNGRLGQSQYGVDVYGIPRGKNRYYGIQCKGKDEYTHSQLTKDEINVEISKARRFSPTLEVFIIAATSNKDAVLEEYVRTKNIESRNANGFGIEVFFWEDIVDLINDNRSTFQWYVRDQHYNDVRDVDIYLNDFNVNKLTLEPRFKKKVIKHIVLPPLSPIDYNDIPQQTENDKQTYMFTNLFSKSFESIVGLSQLPGIKLDKIDFPFGVKTSYRSMCKFEIIIANTGSMVIEDWRVDFLFDGEFNMLSDNINQEIILRPSNTYCNGNRIVFRHLSNQALIQKNNFFFNVCIRPCPREYEIPINWHLFARDFDKEGVVTLVIKPSYSEEVTEMLVPPSLSDRSDEVIFEEIIDDSE